jgi:4-hydroxybenzoate polyprenyltransferase/phosphoserine phosphatase
MSVTTVTSVNQRPIFVDMDGTLLATDTLWESLILLVKREPLRCAHFPLWLLRGKAYFKRKVAQRVSLNPAHLPYREEVLSFLRAEKESGREIILASASDQRVAEGVAKHLGIFSAVLGSDGVTNLSGRNKLRALEQRTGSEGFDYIGNSNADFPLWQAAHRAILVHPSSSVLRRARSMCSAQQILAPQTSTLPTVIKALRAHQWVKNILLFVPLLTAHKMLEINLIAQATIAFIAFSLCASSVYIVNDLLDLEADRQHPTKRTRPFAAGALQIQTGVLFVPALLIGAVGMAIFFLPFLFVVVLIGYFLAAGAYSFYFKHTLLVDVFVLAGLYTVRVFAGSIAVDVRISPWLLAFSMFFFLSLAFLKRHSELRFMQIEGREHNSGRRYDFSDIDLLRGVGTTSGYLSILVLALYINSKDVMELYQHPSWLWLITPCLLYWITRMWFFAHRGTMTDDPIVFAIRDVKSYLIGGVVLAIIAAASV